MPVTKNAPAPYAPATAVLTLIKRHRERGLPTPVDAEVLKRSGISESLVPRTPITLATVDLIDDKGSPTQTFESLRLAPEGEYKERYVQWLNDVYADVLNFVDPAKADEAALEDAFRSYSPPGQRGRMVTLFSGLYAAANIGPGKEAKGAAQRKPRQQPLTSNSRPVRKPGVTESQDSVAPGDVPPPAADRHAPSSDIISDKALEYKLVDLMRNEDIEDAHRDAIWTLVRYLTARAKTKAADQD